MKKVLSILLVLIMLMSSLVLLSGCSSEKEEEKKETSKTEESEEVWKASDFEKVGLSGVERLEGFKIISYDASKFAIDIQYEADGGTASDVAAYAQKIFDLTDNYSGEITEEFTIELTGEISDLDEATLLNYEEYASFWWYYKYEETTYQVLISGDDTEASISIMDAGI